MIKVPGKTFIFGEYAVLKDGPGLVFCSDPQFELQFASNTGVNISTVREVHKLFHPDSPVGHLISDWLHQNGLPSVTEASAEGSKQYNSRVNSDVNTDLNPGVLIPNFIDPYIGAGGMGGSTAEYLSVFEWLYPSSDVWKMLSDYRRHADGGGLRPSGADLLAQSQGGIVVIDGSRKIIKSVGWPFGDLSFAIFRTGTKLKTHDHLSSLKNNDFNDIIKHSYQCMRAFLTPDSRTFIDSINEFYEILKSSGLQDLRTVKIIERLRLNKSILALKGCGAMGADLIFCLYQNEYEQKVVKTAGEMALSLVCTLHQKSAPRVESQLFNHAEVKTMQK